MNEALSIWCLIGDVANRGMFIYHTVIRDMLCRQTRHRKCAIDKIRFSSFVLAIMNLFCDLNKFVCIVQNNYN